MESSMIVCAVVIVLVLFLILGGPSRYLGYSASERFVSTNPAARACDMCSRHPRGQACAQCKKRSGMSESMRGLNKAGACRHMCATAWNSQSCKACRARTEGLSDPGPCTSQCLGQGVGQLNSPGCAACISAHAASNPNMKGAMLGLME